MSLPKKPGFVSEYEKKIQEPLAMDGYTIDTLPLNKPDLVKKFLALVKERLEMMEAVLKWKRYPSEKLSARKERDARP